ncbi:levanase (2,6-beta-D-fructanfructanohydrolase), partial [gut metagenome]
MKLKTLISTLLLAGSLSAGAQSIPDSLYQEAYRPQYHFSPEKGWIGDPSGLMYYQGKYHMFWWGKAESTDLVHFHQVSPFVMTGENPNISYFTGSAVVDKNNTAGFGKGAFVAAYTIFEKDSKKQAQGISFSHDGKTFHYYDGNPVLDLWSTEFRDPTVFWHEPTQKWVMVVAKALEKKVKFYTSPDLKHWTWTSDFGPAGNSEKSWECPDLFQLPVDGDTERNQWVLVVSVNWAQEQYFIGTFDGTTFRLMENHPSEPLYVDKGLDYYASRTFQDFDGTLSEKISLGWVATWDYAHFVPSQYGKGFWSIPRKLALKTYDEGIRLTQQPIDALQSLRYSPVKWKRTLSVGTHQLPSFTPQENVYELDASFSTEVSNTFGFNLCVGDGHKVVVSYDTDSENLVIDRTSCADLY